MSHCVVGKKCHFATGLIRARKHSNRFFSARDFAPKKKKKNERTFFFIHFCSCTLLRCEKSLGEQRPTANVDRNAKRSRDGVAESGARRKWWNATERGKEKKAHSNCIHTQFTLAYPFVSYLFDSRLWYYYIFFFFWLFCSAHVHSIRLMTIQFHLLGMYKSGLWIS